MIGNTTLDVLNYNNFKNCSKSINASVVANLPDLVRCMAELSYATTQNRNYFQDKRSKELSQHTDKDGTGAPGTSVTPQTLAMIQQNPHVQC